MTGGVYKFIDLVGTSPKSIEDAVHCACHPGRQDRP